MLVPAAADLTFDFIACAFVAGLIAVVLLTGWITRTAAVIWVAILLVVLATLIGGLWIAYRFEALDGPTDYETTTVRLIAGVFASLIVGAVWALFRMPRDARLRMQDHVTPPDEGSTATPQVSSYDHDWLLSLLQQRVAASKEKIAISSDPETDPPSAPASNERDKP